MNDAAWPYPTHWAHRGAGKLAPENTLAAIRHGASLGYRMFEFDVKLSADGATGSSSSAKSSPRGMSPSPMTPPSRTPDRGSKSLT